MYCKASGRHPPYDPAYAGGVQLDHIEGKLFIDYISPLKRKLIRGKLNDITRGIVKVDYKMLFPG